MESTHAATARQGSAALYDVVYERDVMVPARDGTPLATDLYFPAIGGERAPGQFPVILERTPYNKLRLGARDAGYFFARRGYVGAVQDVRGRYASGGTWYPFAGDGTGTQGEGEDGYDAVEWLAAQEWCDGAIGTIGGSYAGATQSALASLNPPHLRAMAISVGPHDYFENSMRHHGTAELRFFIYSFRMLHTNEWGDTMPPGVTDAFRDSHEHIHWWVRRLLDGPFRAGTSPLQHYPSVERYVLDLLSRGEDDEHWARPGFGPRRYYDQHADVPTIYQGGWYDSYGTSTVTNFMEFTRRSRSPQRLIMGPWVHGAGEENYAGEVEFDVEAAQDSWDDVRLRWFDRWLKGLDSGVDSEPPVKLFLMGGGDDDGRMTTGDRLLRGGAWRTAQDWPLPETEPTPYYLHASGGLSAAPPAARAPSGYSFDPRYPVPTTGGNISAADPLMPPGGFDQRNRPDLHGWLGPDYQHTLPLAARADVLTFQTPPLEQPLEVTGSVVVELWASSSAVDTDFTAKLIDVYPPSTDWPDGFALNLGDSVVRARYREGYDQPRFLEPGQPTKFSILLYPTSNLFERGHRIRIDIASSNFPRFDVNPNTGEPLNAHTHHVVARQLIHHDPDHPSHALLPIIPG